jgi:PAS domain S-box-containing protein/putative nucleotidyltransferase with HDIG domain
MEGDKKTGERLIAAVTESSRHIVQQESSTTSPVQGESISREIEETLGAIMDATRESLMLIDREGTVLLSNTVGAQRLGRTVRELVGTSLYDHLPPDVARSRKEEFDKTFATGEPVYFEDSRAGRFFELYVCPVLNVGGGVSKVAIFKHEITERMQVQRELQLHSEILTHMAEGVSLVETSGGTLVYANQAFERIFGYDAGELVGKHVSILNAPSEKSPEETAQEIIQTLHEKGAWTGDVRNIKKDGTVFWSHVNVSSLDHHQYGKVWVGILEDITERKQAEDALRESEERYRTAIESSNDGVAVMKGDLHLYVNRKYLEMFGFDDPAEVIGKTQAVTVHPEDLSRVMDCNRARQRGERVPGRYEFRGIRRNGEELYIEVSGTGISYGGEALSLAYLRDITERKKAEKKLEESFHLLRAMMNGTIESLAATTEIRDPYTAGHQKQVSRLACAIAREMGLDGDNVEGIRVASILHDIGKISAPTEILSKPGQLTAYEFNIIKVHPQLGYEIIKGITFPWPVAEIVLSHHERLDGSGYPRGLKGEEILLEARILAVADVVEAVSSHRPYRPGRGIDVALEEIEKNAGILYDREVVKVCMRLFGEKEFKFGPTAP